MNQDRMATYVGGLVYKKPRQYSVKQPIAFHLKLLKEKIMRQPTLSLEYPHTSLSLPSHDMSEIHNHHCYHKENQQTQQSLREQPKRELL
jgi:hypothetical protein